MDKNHTFKILTVYQDAAAGARANELWVRLAIELKPHLEIANDVWKFELLAHPRLREFAATEATQADMVVISTQGDAGLPPHVEDWLKSWLGRRCRRPFALVALLSQIENSPGLPPLLSVWLRRMAKTAHLDFLCKTGDWREADFEYYIDTFPHRSPMRSAVLEEMLHLELRSRLRQLQTNGVQSRRLRHAGQPAWTRPAPVLSVASAN